MRRVGCAGRIASFTESDDGRMVHLARRHRALPASATTLARDEPFRICASRLRPLRQRLHGRARRGRGRPAAPDRTRSRAISWPTISTPIGTASTARATSGWSIRLAILSPYGPEEKQCAARGARTCGRAPKRWWRSPRWSSPRATTARGRRCNDQTKTARPAGDRRLDPKLLEILVCPLTKTSLDYDAERQELISRAAGSPTRSATASPSCCRKKRASSTRASCSLRSHAPE